LINLLYIILILVVALVVSYSFGGFNEDMVAKRGLRGGSVQNAVSSMSVPEEPERLIESSIEQPKEITKEEVLSGDFETYVRDGTRDGCIEIWQSHQGPGVITLNNYNSDLEISDPSGCYNLMENVIFDYAIRVSGGQGGNYLDCQGFTITGSSAKDGFVISDEGDVRNCNVQGRKSGFLLYDNTKVTNSNSNNNLLYGFYVTENAIVSNSGAIGNPYGFYLTGTTPHVEDSTAIDNGYGFYIQSQYYSQYGGVFRGTAVSNSVGFIVYTQGFIYDSISRDNENDGFWFHGGGGIYDSYSINNHRHGYTLTAGGINIVNSTAIDNDGRGFNLAYRTQNVINCESRGNYDGFVLISPGASPDIPPVFQDCLASDNTRYGFYVNTGEISHSEFDVQSSTATGNQYGFYIVGKGWVSSSTAENNQKDGFYLHNSKVSDCEANNNGRHGFNLNSDSSILYGSATRNRGTDQDCVDVQGNNICYGIYLGGVSFGEAVTSNLNMNGIFVDQQTYLRNWGNENGQVCYNDNHDIYVNHGTVFGTYETSTIPPAGAGDWSDATFIDCSFERPHEPTGGCSPLVMKKPCTIMQ